MNRSTTNNITALHKVEFHHFDGEIFARVERALHGQMLEHF